MKKSYHALIFIIVILISMLVLFENGIEINPVVIFFVVPIAVFIFAYIFSNIKKKKVKSDLGNSSKTLDNFSEERFETTTIVSENNELPEQKNIIKIAKTTYSVFSRFILSGVITFILVMGFIWLPEEGGDASDVLGFFSVVFILPFIILIGGVAGVFLSYFVPAVLKYVDKTISK